ncbi:MAG: glucose 1-dehydrogenase [Proteobacteria bacterium]|nr:glucose 1-dehydrogenase [Pseudomonadota bacterium]
MHVRELFDLTGKVALVTGGGRGIGRHIAVGLAEAGADVAVASRKVANCREVAAELEKLGRRSLALAADLSQPEAVEALVEAVLAEFSRIDILVNNAGTTWAAPILEYPLDGWDRVFDLNVRGLWLLSQRVARHMAEHGGGSIVHVSSVATAHAAVDEEQPVVAYNASKGAVDALTVDMAVKLAPKGIRVNAIAPGPFATDMMNHIRHDPEAMRRFESNIPAGRPGGEDDIKGAAVFLASDAAAYVTGQVLNVDGGSMCVYPQSPR